MNNEIINIIKTLSNNEIVQKLLIETIGKISLKQDNIELFIKENNEKIIHIRDWITSVIENGEEWKKPRVLTIEALNNTADKYFEKKNNKLQTIELDETHEKIVFDLGDYYIVQMLTPEALDNESKQMQHCIGHGGYDHNLDNQDYQYFSLRDKSNNGHITLEIYQNHLLQIQGKQNKTPNEKYLRILFPWINICSFKEEFYFKMKFYYDYELDDYVNFDHSPKMDSVFLEKYINIIEIKKWNLSFKRYNLFKFREEREIKRSLLNCYLNDDYENMDILYNCYLNIEKFDFYIISEDENEDKDFHLLIITNRFSKKMKWIYCMNLNPHKRDIVKILKKFKFTNIPFEQLGYIIFQNKKISFNSFKNKKVKEIQEFQFEDFIVSRIDILSFYKIIYFKEDNSNNSICYSNLFFHGMKNINKNGIDYFLKIKQNDNFYYLYHSKIDDSLEIIVNVCLSDLYLKDLDKLFVLLEAIEIFADKYNIKKYGILLNKFIDL